MKLLEEAGKVTTQASSFFIDELGRQVVRVMGLHSKKYSGKLTKVKGVASNVRRKI